MRNFKSDTFVLLLFNYYKAFLVHSNEVPFPLIGLLFQTLILTELDKLAGPLQCQGFTGFQKQL